MHRITFSLAFLSCFCNAQTPPAHLLIGGGLLGKLDGFCESENTPEPAGSNPCPPGRSPRGGLSGFQQQVQRAKGKDAYVLLTGNNLPKDFNANFKYAGNSFMAQFQSFATDV